MWGMVGTGRTLSEHVGGIEGHCGAVTQINGNKPKYCRKFGRARSDQFPRSSFQNLEQSSSPGVHLGGWADMILKLGIGNGRENAKNGENTAPESKPDQNLIKTREAIPLKNPGRQEAEVCWVIRSSMFPVSIPSKYSENLFLLSKNETVPAVIKLLCVLHGRSLTSRCRG